MIGMAVKRSTAAHGFMAARGDVMVWTTSA